MSFFFHCVNLKHLSHNSWITSFKLYEYSNTWTQAVFAAWSGSQQVLWLATRPPVAVGPIRGRLFQVWEGSASLHLVPCGHTGESLCPFQQIEFFSECWFSFNLFLDKMSFSNFKNFLQFQKAVKWFLGCCDCTVVWSCDCFSGATCLCVLLPLWLAWSFLLE